MRLFDPTTGAVCEAEGGVRRVQAERRWLVQGESAQVQEVLMALHGVASKLTDELLELDFGNSVGWFHGGPLGPLDVCSGKWSEGDYRAMLAQITETAGALPFAASSAGSLPYEQTALDHQPILYHAFAWLRHLVGSPSRPSLELVGPLRSVLARPHRATAREGRVVPVGLARRVDPSALIGIAAGRWPMQRSTRLSLAPALRGLVPIEVEESVLAQDLDTQENRFVRAFLELCAGVVHRIRRIALSGERTGLGRQTLASCDHIETVLRPFATHAMWAGVGRMTQFPSSSTVLQRRHDYRAVFTHYNHLRLGARVPVDAASAAAMLESKSIDTLYEAWTCFAFIAAARPVLGEPTEVRRTASNDLESRLEPELQARWASGASLHYNPPFTRNAPQGFRSYSRGFKPDLLFTVPAGPSVGRHVFDAKFKLRQTSWADAASPKATFKSEDLNKMHTYRDALDGVRSAWVLYPGTAFGFYPTEGPVARSANKLGAQIDGVGGVPLVPSQKPSELTAVIARLCGEGP